jgi:hypothetical protein
VQKSGFTCLPGRMNEKILHIFDQYMYIIIHISERIDHVMPFPITQACGVEYSSHLAKIRLFGVGCKIKLKR